MKKSATVTKEQYDYIKNLLSEHCLAKVQKLTLEYLFNKDIKEIKYGYCSNEFKTVHLVVSAINSDAKYLHIV